jgi:GntR family transcriptional regulator/MocR family aminotransferase
VDAYAQLLAEGYLVARRGAGTYVAEAAGAISVPAAEPALGSLGYDFFPGYPDLASFPRRAWLRSMREVLAVAPPHSFGYPDPRGALELRRALAEHLRRVRGVVVEERTIVVCSGAAQGLVLLARALGRPHIAMEDPGLPPHRGILAAHGARLSALAVDAEGARMAELARIEAQHGVLDAVFVTPAHQSPTGVALAPGRRAALLEWASASGGLVIEDDYDAEYRYDRAPLAALQGLAPDRVIYMGTVSKTLAPALRLGWLVLPPRWLDAVLEQKTLADHGCPTLDQLLRPSPAPGSASLQGAPGRAPVSARASPAGRPRHRARSRPARDRPASAAGRRAGLDAGSAQALGRRLSARLRVHGAAAGA